MNPNTQTEDTNTKNDIFAQPLEASHVPSFVNRIFNISETTKYTNLETFEQYSSGSMTGGYQGKRINSWKGETILTIATSNWHHEPLKVTEFLIDKEVLTEIEKIFNQHKLYKWKDKKLSKMFVADAPTTHCVFIFPDQSFSFSSQVFPNEFDKAINEIKLVMEKYEKSGKRLPGLVVPAFEDTDIQQKFHEFNDTAELIAFTYRNNELTLLIKNGTEENLVIPAKSSMRIKLGDKTVFENTINNQLSFAKLTSSYETFPLEERLESGIYTLEFGDLTGQFEIR
ncbi:MAG: hypothetical protein ACI4VX_04505 [Succinivibrionaceae bacterium]